MACMMHFSKRSVNYDDEIVSSGGTFPSALRNRNWSSISGTGYLQDQESSSTPGTSDTSRDAQDTHSLWTPNQNALMRALADSEFRQDLVARLLASNDGRLALKVRFLIAVAEAERQDPGSPRRKQMIRKVSTVFFSRYSPHDITDESTTQLVRSLRNFTWTEVQRERSITDMKNIIVGQLLEVPIVIQALQEYDLHTV